ncbi:C3a anaphylatoxin chemotactic receptor-like isoform X2 [Ctenopharyngodon idella]|uniref:C3a anaphylatoxin chemotactic receptor-like isoform X2 n=1 Tax=Ctenopharyngodon idella TaxID=7959 RepID=UPI00223202AC|nr:C3a anaphylatoxin chemotactic receptor-like isoform X2 [Ctenopharyngodon idella]
MENVTNATTQTEALSSIEIFNIFIYFVTFVLGIVGNGLVIFVTGYKMKMTVNSIWFLNLAIAHFIFTLVIILYIVSAFNKMAWHFGDFMCKFVSFVAVLYMFASIFLLTAISLDGCQFTWMIVWAQNKQTLVKAWIICALVWVLSILCSIPFVINRLEKDNQCTYNTLSIFRSLVIYRFIVGFLIPFLIIASSHIAIGVRARRLKRGKKPSFWVIISVIMAFFICWFPFHVQQLCTIIAYENNWSDFKKVINDIGPFVNCLVHLNSCLNPILYVFLCEEFRKRLKQSLLHCTPR